MDRNRETVCLSMIVRNEAAVIERCLASVIPLIDHWVIVDTGSSDVTQALIGDRLRDVPGTLHERPWRNFASNRNEALDLARGHADYCLLIDADDTIEVAADYRWPRLDADGYWIDIADDMVCYRRLQLVSLREPWRYEGVLHEYLTREGAGPHGELPGIRMRRNHDGARRRNPATYREDAALLGAALAGVCTPGLRARYTFYLAQSLRDSGQQQRAMDHYLERAAMGLWDEEVFVSLVQAARLQEQLGYSTDTVLETYARAAASCAARSAEALHGASRLCRTLGRHTEGYDLAVQGRDRRQPKAGLFVEPWIYRYGLLDELAVNAFWSGHLRVCLETCIVLLARDDLGVDNRARIAGNADKAARRLGGLTRPVSAGLEISLTGSESTWLPDRPLGGTELMVEGLRHRLGERFGAVDLHVNAIGARRPGVPLVVWVHHDVDQAAMQWCAEGELAEQVDRFVFVSHWQRERFESRFALRPERCCVLRNATEVPDARLLPRDSRCMRFAYTSTPARGLSVLLDAWQMLCAPDTELHVWSSVRLYGPGFDDAADEAVLARARSMPAVHYHGLAPNPVLRRALQDIDCLAYPCTFPETSCLAVIEALANGCRVVCPTLGALPETTAGFATLYPVQPEPVRHAMVLADLLQHEIEADRVQRTADSVAQHAYARAVLDWPVRLREWSGLLDQLGR